MSPWPGNNTDESPAEAAEVTTLVSYYEGQPVLVTGDAGEHVVALCALLAVAGYETPVSRGEVRPVLTDDVYEAVERFRRECGEEDGFDELTEGGRRTLVGPLTWAALTRAAAA